MNSHRLAQGLVIAAVALASIGGIGLFRYYQTTPELRLPEYEARWQLVLPAAVVVLAVALLLLLRKDSAAPSLARSEKAK